VRFSRGRRLAALRAPAAGVGLACGLAAPRVAANTAFPAQPVRIVVPFSVGLGPDVVVRALAQQLAHGWSQPVVVDNRPGGSGAVAMIEARAAPRDGHTLVLGEAGSLAVLPLILRHPGYDPLRDFEPLTTVFRAIFALVTGAGSRFADVASLLAHARSGSGRVSYASFGNGHASQLAVEHFARQAGVRLHHVPFRDGGQLLAAVAQGDVDFTAISMISAAGFVKGGKLRALAVAAPRRLKDWPELPTLAQAGGPAVDMMPWAALLAPAGTPATTVDTLRTALAAALDAAEVRSKVESMGFEVLRSSPAQLVELIRAESELARALIRDGRIATE